MAQKWTWVRRSLVPLAAALGAPVPILVSGQKITPQLIVAMGLLSMAAFLGGTRVELPRDPWTPEQREQRRRATTRSNPIRGSGGA